MDAMLSDLEDFIRSVSDAAGEEAPKFRRSDLAEHLASFLDQVEDGDAEFALFQDAYLAPGGQTLFVPGSGGVAVFDEVLLDSDEALPWLEYYHRQGQHPPEWPAAMPLPEEPIDLEALAQEVRLGQAAERVEQALETHRATPEGLASWTQEDLDNARTALQEVRGQHASLVSFSQEEADEDEPGLSAEAQAWFEAVEDGRVVLEEEAAFAFGLPTPFEEGKHPRGYGGRWANKPGAAEAAKAHGAAEKNLRKQEVNLGKLAQRVAKLHQAHAVAKAAHAEAKKKAKGKPHSRAALEAHQVELAAIRAKGKLDAAKAAHGQAKKEHGQAKKEHGQTAKALEKVTKEKPARKPAEKKPLADKKEPKPKKAPAKAKQLQVPDVPGFRPGEVKVDPAAYIPDDKPIQDRIKDYTRGDQLIQAMASIDRVRDWASQRSIAAARELDWDTYRQAVGIQDQYTGIGGRDAAHQILAVHMENKVDWRTDVKGDLDPNVRLAHDQGMEFLRNMIGKGHGGLGFQTASVQQVPKDVEQRAYHSTSLGIHLSEKSNAGTMVHEFGHWLDDHLPGVLEATQAFLKYRVGNEPTESMADVSTRVYGHSSGYGADEMGRKDHFDRAFPEVEAYYTGKDYGNRATEVLSMGLEKLYNDPVDFAKKDPEFFKFILGISDGSLRDHDLDRGLDLGDLGGF
jgi:hypothetical protein